MWAVSLVLLTLLHSALPLIPLALEDLTLPCQAFVDDVVSLIYFSELNGYARCSLGDRFSSSPNMSYLCLRHKCSLVWKNPASVFSKLVHIHRAIAYAAHQSVIRQDLY